METVLHRADTRGHFNHGWLKTYHTFSFAEYFDPARVNFGALRVLNDDTIAPGQGFGMHPHNNMEIITIPLHGDLEHKDSMGHTEAISEGEIQVMSAGTGIHHSEYNKNNNRPVELLQIWVIPEKKSVEPRYENAVIADLIRKNELSEIVSPYPGTGKGLWIHQQAWFSIGDLDPETTVKYTLKSPDSLGVYVFVIKGSITAGNVELNKRDGLGITKADSFKIKALTDARVLLMEVPPVK